MGNSLYTYHESKTLATEEISGENTSFFLCNSLEEKRKYIYFRRGNFGTPDYECGRKKYKIRKAGLAWLFQEVKSCQAVELEIWKVLL